MPHACFLDERKSVHVKAIPRIINIIYVRKRSLWGVKKNGSLLQKPLWYHRFNLFSIARGQCC